MGALFFLLKSSRGIVLVALVAGAVAGLSNTGLLALINATLSGSRPAASLIPAFVGLCLLMVVSRFVSNLLLVRLSNNAVYDLRVFLSRRILSAPLRRLEELGGHRLLATLTDDVPVIANALSNIPLLCMNIVIVAGCLVYLGWLSWSVLLGVLGFMACGVVVYQLLMKRALQYVTTSRQQWDVLFKHLRALVDGTKELKLHRMRREAFLAQSLETSAAALRHHAVLSNSIYAAASSWGHVLIFILVGLLLFAAPTGGVGQLHTTLGYVLVILYMMSPMEFILAVAPALGRADVALKKIDELGLRLQDDAEAVADFDLARAPAWGRLDVIGITHAYYNEGEDDQFVLGPIDLSFEPGELVFLVGGNGSGKTTLAKLLTGLYIPEGGEIRLGGQLITDENREAYRQFFSVVFSDFFLFDSILGLDTEGLDAKARSYLRQLQLHHKVKIKDAELSTTDLSQGQRKRLALLTAYLEDRPFYLFDEWAADQDPVFKEVFYLQILPELKARRKTVLVITHDDHYFSVADRIVKLDYGKLDAERALDAGHTLKNYLPHSRA
ncbi:MAG: cyclic peptide export ABC transporter [Pyrinomonadaceae bacterium]